MQVHRPIGRQLRILVRFVADEPLTADDAEVGAELPWIGDLIIGARLEAKARYPGQVVAGDDEDIAVGVGEWIVRRRQSQSIAERSIDGGIIGIGSPAILLVRDFGFNALTQRIAAILKKLVAGNWAGDGEDVVDVERVVGAEAPIEQSFGDIEVPAHTAFERVRYDLIEIGIADKGVVDQAWPHRIGTAE